MEDREIIELFKEVADNTVYQNKEIQRVFFTLVKTTLRYRDHLKESKNVIVTVEDVKSALDWLVPTLNTGKLPEIKDKIRLDLLKLWVEELRLK